jgi:RNA recognition motif-containing protein
MEDAEDSEVDAEAEIEKLLAPAKKNKDRKRKRNDVDDLESKYLNKLADEEEREEQQLKKKRQEEAEAEAEEEDEEEDDEEAGEDAEEGTSSEEDDEEEGEDVAEEASAADTSSSEGESGDESDSSAVPVHESLSKKPTTAAAKNDEVEKANRTVFLSNVAISASTDKAAKKELLAHLASALPEGDKVETIRFRSLAFSTAALPKRAAYITAATMESTTKSANAYVVYSSAAAARAACAALNGTIILDRHLRVDSVAHPSATDHRRCVFVGNLGFVDDETVVNTNAAGETTTRKRTKIPSDTEEGLWRTFTKNAGKVENVRVVRDPKTRVGKGFAYVQFYVSPSLTPTLCSANFRRTKTRSRQPSSSTARSTPPCSRASSASPAPRPPTRPPWPRSARPRPPPSPPASRPPATRRAQSTSTRPRPSNSPWPVAPASCSAAPEASARHAGHRASLRGVAPGVTRRRRTATGRASSSRRRSSSSSRDAAPRQATACPTTCASAAKRGGRSRRAASRSRAAGGSSGRRSGGS